MTAILDYPADVQPRKPLHQRVPVDEITAQAREVRPGRVVAGLIGGLLFVIGWVLAKSWRVAFFAGAWCAVAVRTGWRQAQGKPLSQPSLEKVLAENARLRAELARVT